MMHGGGGLGIGVGRELRRLHALAHPGPHSRREQGPEGNRAAYPQVPRALQGQTDVVLRAHDRRLVDRRRVPLVYRAIIDTGIGHRDTRLIVVLALVIGGLAVLDAGLSLGEQLCTAQVGQGLIYDLRTQVYTHVQKMSLAFFTRTQTGALVSRLNNDVLGAQQATTDILSSVVGNLLSVLMVLTTMLILSWQITLVALALLPAFAIPARFMGRRLGAITREGYVLAADMNATMAERFNVAGALLVKLFGRPGEEEELFAGRAGRVRDIAILQSIYARVFFISLTVTAALATALVYGWGGSMVVHGLLELGTLVAMTAYLNRLYGPLTQLSNVNVDVMTALVSFDRVFELLDLAPMIAEREDAVTLPHGPATIEFGHVDFTYPRAGEPVSLASLESVAGPDPRGRPRRSGPETAGTFCTSSVRGGTLVNFVGVVDGQAWSRESSSNLATARSWRPISQAGRLQWRR